MDGFASSGRVVVIAASNLLEKLDPALLRPGRFDRQVFVVPPDVRGREGVLQVHTRDKPLADVDLGLVAQQTSGLTGADLANICNEAAIFATRRKARRSRIGDFDSAIERVIAGVQSRRVLNEHEKRVVAFHEAGHALCGELLPSVDRVHRISIVPRGRALGYTLNLPAEDRYLKTREELLDYMTVLLGGRVAEQIVFGAITTGASDDLKRVAEIAHSMVHDFAMGTAGMGRSPDGDVRLSETTLRIRDEERQDLIEEARRAAQRLILAHRAQLDALARELLEHEVLEREAIERIMAGVPRLERAPGVGLRVVAAASATAALARVARRRAGAIDCAACSGASTTSASPSRSSSRRSSSTATSFELTLAHREVVRGAGRRGGAAGRRREPRRAARAARRGHARRQVPRQERPRPAPRRLPGAGHRRDARRAQAGRPGADRRAAAHRHPRLARRVRAPARDRRRADRDRAAGSRRQEH